MLIAIILSFFIIISGFNFIEHNNKKNLHYEEKVVLNARKKNINEDLKNYVKDLEIYGPFTFEEKASASRILSRILCQESDKNKIRTKFQKDIIKNKLPKGIDNSFEVINAANMLKSYLKNKCTELDMSDTIEKDIFNKSFRFNK